MRKNEILNDIKKAGVKVTALQIFRQNNKKLKKQGIADFNLPAVKTCPYALECIDDCFATKAFYRMPTVKNAYERNYILTLGSDFIKIADQSVKMLAGVKYLRVHSSGDFYNRTYLKKWLEVADLNPNKIFYGYTRSTQLFKGLEIPENFIFCHSSGAIKESSYINTLSSVARIYDTQSEIDQLVLTGNYIDCSVNDLLMIEAVITKKNICLLRH